MQATIATLRILFVLVCVFFGLMVSGVVAAEATVKPAEAESSNVDSDSPRTETNGTEANIPLAGHSEHGDAYNDGPRQNAYLMGGTGNVRFTVSTSVEEAQQFFTQAIGQMHGFWYYEAERSFRRVATLDPRCAMAYWGMALANRENKKRAREFISEAVQRRSLATRREQLYINALNKFLTDEKDEKDLRRDYVRALEQIIREFPDDIEAKGFLAVHLWQSHRNGVPINSHQAVDSLLGDIFRIEPMHPAHHFRIHLWDNEQPSQALSSAALCGQAAPSIAHMWHMPGHIYSRLKRYDDAVFQQEASARVDHAHMMRDRVLPDQIHNFAHNNEWLIRNLIHLGRARDGISLAKNMLELPRHPKFNSFDKKGSCSCKYGRRRLFQVLETFQMWDEVVALADTMYLEPTDKREEQAKRLRLLGVARYHRGEGRELRENIEELEKLLRQQKEEAEQEVEKAAADARDQGKSDEEIEKAKQKAVKSSQQQTKSLEQAIAELNGLKYLARGETELAKEQFDRSSDIPKLHLARYCFLTGDHARTEKLVNEAVQRGENEVPPLAVKVDLFRRMGKWVSAKSAFELLRTVGGSADLDSPLLRRVTSYASDMDMPEDWRIPPEPQDDTGDRPELGSLGPFRWGPSPAEPWSLANANGSRISLSDYRGRPVIVIFYLGFGCLHCVEQLQAFSPMVDDYQQAGVSLVAISSEQQDELVRAMADFSKDGTFPIPLVSDANLDVFRAYRAYDDFENMPLHGTFFIDGHGMVRWQDVSYEPFMEADFLLKEVNRLLSMDSNPQPLADKGVARVDGD